MTALIHSRGIFFDVTISSASDSVLTAMLFSAKIWFASSIFSLERPELKNPKISLEIFNLHKTSFKNPINTEYWKWSEKVPFEQGSCSLQAKFDLVGKKLKNDERLKSISFYLQSLITVVKNPSLAASRAVYITQISYARPHIITQLILSDRSMDSSFDLQISTFLQILILRNFSAWKKCSKIF